MVSVGSAERASGSRLEHFFEVFAGSEDKGFYFSGSALHHFGNVVVGEVVVSIQNKGCALLRMEFADG